MVAPLALLGLSAASNLVGSVVDALGSKPTLGSQPATGASSTTKLKATADDFEKNFLETMLDRVTDGAGPDGPLGEGGTGGSVYKSMLVKEYAGKVVQGGGVGLSGAVYRQLLQLQEGSGHAG